MQACAARSNKRSDNAMLDKGRAVQCRAVIQRGRAVKENIISGQSGDCLVYLGWLIYIQICAWTMVCAQYMANYRWHHLLSSNKMPCLVGVRGATVGVIRHVRSNRKTRITNHGNHHSK